ncbi:uncharacterized protein LOC129778343 [Toxorhynchites rutilus septentrionalis]|uniref:uncharacterized protein LOC129778343 n=1 Tax=Toxorhynchites rutilus septentrionalis TaxID=329112 RepID=UPI00247984E2|nr:uncharacterized protein LOC129778343 [Toxorhynchites rutilus septentrionalis]
MSLQVQSSQQPVSSSGRRTPQVYQNFGSTNNTSPSSNGNNNGNKSSSRSSSRSSNSDKQNQVTASPEAVTAEQPAPKESPKSSVAPATPTKTAGAVAPATATASAKVETNGKNTVNASKADKQKDEKVSTTATNGSSGSEKESNGKKEENVAPETVPAPETPKKEEEKEKKVKDNPRSSPRTTPQKLQLESIPVEQPTTPESAGKKPRESPVLVTPEQGKKTKHTLLATKALKAAVTAEGDEMEALVVEPSEYEDSPIPTRTGGKTKLLKYGAGPPTRARISPFRVNQANAAVATANLSTVSEGQNSASDSKETSPSMEMDFDRPLRAISGRRSTRPISDIRYTYRKSADLNDSVSSLNVTIGSEIHNDSLRTPAPGSSRKRKAMTPESTSDAVDVKEIVDSPKRGRLDFSGLLGMVSSPMTMLKNRLSRVRLHASTPVAKLSFDEDDLTRCVTAEATTTTANISGEEAKMDVESSAEEETKAKHVEEGGDQKKDTETETPKDEQNESATEKVREDVSGDAPVVVREITEKQRQYCAIM